MNSKRLVLPVLIILGLTISHIHAVTVEGDMVFIGPKGGNLKFGSTVVFTQYQIVNAINRYTGYTQGGVNVGGIGFDCDTGVNMTITAITTRAITYTVTEVGTKKSYVYYSKFAEPVDITGDDSYTYDSGTRITTITHTGDVTIVIQYDTVSSYLNDGAYIASNFMFLIIVGSILKYLYKGGELGTAFTYFAISLVVYLAVVLAITNMGY